MQFKQGMSLATAILALAFISGCIPKKPDETAGPAPVVILPVTNDGDIQVVQLTANDTMRFNGNRFTVQTGKQVRVELKSTGTKPRTEMAHNFVVLKPGTDVEKFNTMSAVAKADGYMPKDLMTSVIASTGFAGPGETVSATFAAPAPGDYVFLCNFPGHYAAGMKGVMEVVP